MNINSFVYMYWNMYAFTRWNGIRKRGELDKGIFKLLFNTNCMLVDNKFYIVPIVI